MTRLQKLRKAAAAKQAYCCFYCGFPMWDEGEGETFADVLSISNRLAAKLRCTAEHLTAKADGGPTTPRNIVAVCQTCNARRHRRRTPKPPDVYKMLVENRLARGAWHPDSLHAALRSFVPAGHDEL